MISSSEIECPFRLLIGNVAVCNALPSDPPQEAYYLVTLQLSHQGTPLTPLLESSASVGEWGEDGRVLRIFFNEWIEFPLTISFLELDTELTLRLFHSNGTLVGECTVFLFHYSGVFKTGTRLYHLHDDGNTMPCSSQGDREEWEAQQDAVNLGLLPSLDWLDDIANRHFDEVRYRREEEEEANSARVGTITVHFPTSEVPIVMVHPSLSHSSAETESDFLAVPDGITPLLDAYHWNKEHNLSEARAALLSKSLLLSGYDAQSPPGLRDRKRLSSLLHLLPLSTEPLSSEEEALLWRYRAYISKDHRHFLTFMKQVNWKVDSVERRRAIKLIEMWKPIKLPSILCCLSYLFKGVDPIRQYAVTQLGKEADSVLCRIGFFLVQAIQYDHPVKLELGRFLVQRALLNWELCSVLWWGVTVQMQTSLKVGDESPPTVSSPRPSDDVMRKVFDHFLEQVKLKRPDFEQRLIIQQQFVKSLRELSTSIAAEGGNRTTKIDVITKKLTKGKSVLCDMFPLSKGKAASSVAPGPSSCTLFAPSHPTVALHHMDPNSFYIFKSANMPFKLNYISSMVDITELSKTKVNRGSVVVEPSSGEKDIHENSTGSPVLSGVAVSLEDRPSCVYAPTAAPGVGSSTLFELSLMFKANDNVRQDEMVVSLIGVMDSLLKRDGLDMCLTAYRVMGSGPRDGIIEVVPGVVTLQALQRGIVEYLQQYNTTPDLLQLAMSRYVRSLAGYSVISFVLGLGDRHLENILLCRDGRLLHIDFGYILGNDPKPFPPPMKITREMLEALGGPTSDHYLRFITYCSGVYNIIRKNADLIINALTLVVHTTDLPQIAAPSPAESPVDPRAQVFKVQDRLRLDFNNAQATQYIQQVVADSVGSVMANLWDVLHVAAQATRS